MILPQLMNHWQRIETENKLKQTYSMLKLALETAEVKHGEPDGWGYDTYVNITQASGDDLEEQKKGTQDEVNSFVNEILKPNLKMALDSEDYKKRSVFHGNKIKVFKNNKLQDLAADYKARYFILPNGASVGVFINDHSATEESSEPSAEPASRIWGHISMLIDTNGTSRPNIFGKDVFEFMFAPEDDYFGPYKKSDHQEAKAIEEGKTLREYYYTYCSNGGNSAMYCAKLIELDGWKINPKDYPWWKNKK